MNAMCVVCGSPWREACQGHPWDPSGQIVARNPEWKRRQTARYREASIQGKLDAGQLHFTSDGRARYGPTPPDITVFCPTCLLPFQARPRATYCSKWCALYAARRARRKG